jgi:hypothetical protein
MKILEWLHMLSSPHWNCHFFTSGGTIRGWCLAVCYWGQVGCSHLAILRGEKG